MGTSKDNNKNINEPGYEEENEYRKKNAEEAEKLPVEYLGHIKRTRESRIGRILLTITLLILFLGVGPSTKGEEYCPRCGMWRANNTLAWGNLNFKGVPRESDWTVWYESHEVMPHEHNWLAAGEKYNGFFIFLNIPFPRDLGWVFPENLVSRMQELDAELRPGYIMDVPRVLGRVSNGREWNAIMLPLTEGTVEQAYDWWEAHKDALKTWSEHELVPSLNEDYIAAAEEYVDSFYEPDGNEIPLM